MLRGRHTVELWSSWALLRRPLPHTGSDRPAYSANHPRIQSRMVETMGSVRWESVATKDEVIVIGKHLKVDPGFHCGSVWGDQDDLRRIRCKSAEKMTGKWKGIQDRRQRDRGRKKCDWILTGQGMENRGSGWLKEAKWVSKLSAVRGGGRRTGGGTSGGCSRSMMKFVYHASVSRF